MLRGELASCVGCNSETVRYYENVGLLPDPPRAENGYRVYDRGHRSRLSFIVRARGLGFSVVDVRGLLELVDGNAVSCGEVRERCLEHLGVVRARLRELRKLDRALADIIDECQGDDTPECAFIEELFDDGK